jgi:hypothetical protein
VHRAHLQVLFADDKLSMACCSTAAAGTPYSRRLGDSVGSELQVVAMPTGERLLLYMIQRQIHHKPR